MSKFIDEILLIGGCVLILIGFYRLIPEATWFVGGFMLIIAGILSGIGNRKTK